MFKTTKFCKLWKKNGEKYVYPKRKYDKECGYVKNGKKLNINLQLGRTRV